MILGAVSQPPSKWAQCPYDPLPPPKSSDPPFEAACVEKPVGFCVSMSIGRSRLREKREELGKLAEQELSAPQGRASRAIAGTAKRIGGFPNSKKDVVQLHPVSFHGPNS